jgi:spore coat polysaccharide biosynthesis predicted glycosyltransferase SpsG/RimJ/RimL family protein N-acetyltransferase
VTQVAFRCDGGERIGAGHVARCLQIARAFEAAGDEPLFVGAYDGVARALLDAAGMPQAAPGPGAAGLPERIGAAVVDSYAIEPAELARAAHAASVAAISDADPVPGVTTLTYHLDASTEAELCGPDYAPVDPAFAGARRARGLERVLLSLGGGNAAADVRERALGAARALGPLELAEAGGPDGPVEAGLVERARWADVAISGGGLTPYELACAGVPAVIVALADNQRRVVRAFAEHGLAVGVEDAGALPGAVARLAAAETRALLAESGPATVDGYGAFRARDALKASLAGDPLPRVLRYRPGGPADSERLLRWRNDPVTRATSRVQEPVEPQEHERWLDATLADPGRVLLIAEQGGVPVGMLRFDLDEREAEVSVTIAPEQRGGGLGPQAIAEATELALAARPALERIVAQIRPENHASTASFGRAGYSELAPRTEGMLCLGRARGPRPGG